MRFTSPGLATRDRHSLEQSRDTVGVDSTASDGLYHDAAVSWAFMSVQWPQRGAFGAARPGGVDARQDVLHAQGNEALSADNCVIDVKFKDLCIEHPGGLVVGSKGLS